MKRLVYYDLKEWLDSKVNRKPVLLFGARQVGKTHLARMLGKEMPSFVEINFEKKTQALRVFEGDLDPIRMIRELSLIADQEIIPGKTLLFLDEIQDQPRAITALRYFYEEMPELHIMAAGSLLDFALDSVGVPVGRVTFRWIYPLTFIEFLVATGHRLLAKAIISQPADKVLSEPIHEKALELVSQYMCIGGMPEVVAAWAKHGNIKLCQDLQINIIQSYEKDFPKYAKKHQVKYVDILFRQIPRHITKSFKFNLIESAFTKRELNPALHLLEKARILKIILRSHGTGLPLGAEVDHHHFKIIFLDVALTQVILGLSIKNWFLEPQNTLANKGEITEAFVGQELLGYQLPNQSANLYYWHRLSPSSQAEVDYLIDYQRQVIPVEVKSGHNASLQSLRIFLVERPASPFGIRFSIYNFSYFDKLQNYPLYAVANIINDKKLLHDLLNDD